MSGITDRREFLKTAAAAGTAAVIGTGAFADRLAAQGSEPLFKISLAQWSLHKMLFAGELDALDFPMFAKETFGIEAVEYVNQFFMSKARDREFFSELKQRCDDNGVRSLLIMCDREGDLGDPDPNTRRRVIENHYKWVEAAEFLGCHSIRVNAASAGGYHDQIAYAATGLRRLSEFAADHGLNVIVENHGGLSSNGEWLSAVIERVGRENCGTLPDFGNFTIAAGEVYDRYKGVGELMPYARGVSAKSYDFDADGNSVTIDYRRMLRVVLDAGYRGHIGVEWEGSEPGEVEGVRLTKALLERLRDELSGEYV